MDTERMPAFRMKDIAQVCKDHLRRYDYPYADVFPFLTEHPEAELVSIHGRPDADIYGSCLHFQAEEVVPPEQRLYERKPNGELVCLNSEPARFRYRVGRQTGEVFSLPIDSMEHLRCILQALFRIRTDAEYDALATREYFDMSPEQRAWWVREYGDTTHMPNPYRESETA